MVTDFLGALVATHDQPADRTSYRCFRSCGAGRFVRAAVARALNRQRNDLMSDYTSDLPVQPKQLEAIGLIAAEWSYLESVMEAAIWNLAYLPDEDVAAAVTTHLAWRPRSELLATLFDLEW